MIYDLQSRWKMESNHLKYYGLRNAPQMFKNEYRVNKKQKAIIERFPAELTPKDQKTLKPFLGLQVVPAAQKRRIPQNLTQARFCNSCVANDFMIPGLEFDEKGQCLSMRCSV